MASVLTIYPTEVDWLALVELTNGSKVTLKFDHQPNEAEVLANAAPFEAPSESPYEIETEGGGVV
jgi:hypothetical protein